MMKYRWILVSTLLLVSCSTAAPKADGTDPTARPEPSTRSAADNNDDGPTDVDGILLYDCESGESVWAQYRGDSEAWVGYQDLEIVMTLAVSASGARYVGGGLEWWTRGSGPGSDGTLFEHLADGTTGERVELCVQVPVQEDHHDHDHAGDEEYDESDDGEYLDEDDYGDDGANDEDYREDEDYGDEGPDADDFED